MRLQTSQPGELVTGGYAHMRSGAEDRREARCRSVYSLDGERIHKECKGRKSNFHAGYSSFIIAGERPLNRSGGDLPPLLQACIERVTDLTQVPARAESDPPAADEMTTGKGKGSRPTNDSGTWALQGRIERASKLILEPQGQRSGTSGSPANGIETSAIRKRSTRSKASA